MMRKARLAIRKVNVALDSIHEQSIRHSLKPGALSAPDMPGLSRQILCGERLRASA
jgi:hypothetical protein